MNFWLCRVFVAAHGLSLVVASGGYSLRCGVWGLLMAVAPLVAEQGLQGTWASVVVVPRLLEHRLNDCGTWA